MRQRISFRYAREYKQNKNNDLQNLRNFPDFASQPFSRRQTRQQMRLVFILGINLRLNFIKIKKNNIILVTIIYDKILNFWKIFRKSCPITNLNFTFKI